MSAPTQESENPLGLSLDFMFGRGYLWAERQRLRDWLALETLRMEIPDLQFPFDARGGLDRFRHTRCLVREMEVAISEVGLGDQLVAATAHVDGFQDLQIRFLEDAAHISVKVSSLGANTTLSFRATLIPPEPARADEVHLSLYDYRAFGPLPHPARLVVHELVTGLLNTPVLRSPGRGRSFTVGVAGDIVRFRPLKLLLLQLFPRVGWKLPDLSGVVLESARIRPGVLTLRAVDDDPQAGAVSGGADFELATSTEGAKALAAYEAKELFSHADRALFEGQIRQALSLLSNYRDVYGLHPALVARLLDCLIADGSPGNLAEAESIRRELIAEDPEDLLALTAAPNVALARRRPQQAIEAFEALSAQLQKRQQTRDWILCELALAELLAQDNPERAARRLREVLKRDPRHRGALEALRQIYERLGEPARLEETLKRLTGVYSDRETLKKTYLELASHLMDRQGDLAEARMYLEKVLRIDAQEVDALHALGESYILGGESLRALKAFGSAARIAEVQKRLALASRLHQRIAEIWYDELEDPRQALLGYQQALELSGAEGPEGGAASGSPERSGDAAVAPMVRADMLRGAAQMCEALSRHEEAARYWTEAVNLLERLEAGKQGPGDAVDDESEAWRPALVRAHRHLGAIYERRQRPAVAASHYRRILEYESGDDEALDWLETHLRRAGRPEELIELYDDLLQQVAGDEERVELTRKLADLYGQLGDPDQAQRLYRRALELAPGDSETRQKMVQLLSTHGRFETLRDALNSVLVRTRDRQIQYEISMELGAAAQAMGDDARAVRSYMEALKLRGGDREALQKASDSLREIVESKGASAAAPVGSTTAGRLLEKLLIQLAEVVPSVLQQREALLEVAMVADERGDSAAAAEARDRAQALAGVDDDDGFDDVDSRLDALLEDFEALDVDTGPVSVPGPPTREEISQDGTEADEGTADHGDDDDELASFRRRFASMIKEPSELSSPGGDRSESPVDKILERSGQRRREAPQTVRMEQSGFESLLDEERGEAPATIDDEATSPRIHPVQIGMSEIDELRRQGDPQELAQAIEHVLTLEENTDSEILGEQTKGSLAKEAGELFYYDLEDGEAALPLLEKVHHLDPDGDGASPEVVNALEALYEERGEVASRIELLKRRLKHAESGPMKTTYRLLIAQLFWDQNQDEEGARRWLDEVLSEEPHHEAAHRLMAEMARDRDDWASAAQHMEVVIEQSPGGIEAVEIQRELGHVYREQLDDPQRGLACFEGVLDEAPGDAQALEGIKQCQAALGDWEGYVQSLARELGLLTGAGEPFSLEAMLELDASTVAPALQVAAAEIVADAAQLTETELEQLDWAHRLWGLSHQLWSEQVEALERRIELGRQLDTFEALVEDLGAMAEMVLDPHRKVEIWMEVGTLHLSEIDDAQAAKEAYQRAVQIAEACEGDSSPDVADARRAIKKIKSRNQL